MGFNFVYFSFFRVVTVLYVCKQVRRVLESQQKC